MAGQTGGPGASDQNRSADDSSGNSSEFRGPSKPIFHVWLFCGNGPFLCLNRNFTEISIRFQKVTPALSHANSLLRSHFLPTL